ncbi:hypothetical protein CIG11343_0589 [Campylobacter iguaniorum]|uniref:hypothetical protein n=1 Tax=Campylobacter iguaniorum TaxID=1244531 RepID=UPI0007C9B18D|nr:hypothetical protein [Campylobacter iguaniorum]ANE35650.1 hypothetical protein CIG11343_0589 [Campylobacter iguaniorum]
MFEKIKDFVFIVFGLFLFSFIAYNIYLLSDGFLASDVARQVNKELNITDDVYGGK